MHLGGKLGGRSVILFRRKSFVLVRVQYNANHLKPTPQNDPRTESDGHRQSQNFTKIKLLHNS